MALNEGSLKITLYAVIFIIKVKQQGFK